MTMPKTTVNKDDRPVFGKNYIGRPRKAFIIYSISKSKPPKSMTQRHFRLCVR